MRREQLLLAMASPRLGPQVEDVTFARLCRSRDFLAASLDLRVRLNEAAGEAYLSPFHYHRMFTRALAKHRMVSYSGCVSTAPKSCWPATICQ